MTTVHHERSFYLVFGYDLIRLVHASQILLILKLRMFFS